MDYSLLKKVSASKRVSLKRLAALIDMTEGGFFAALRNDTMTCAKLEKCAAVLGCSICDFFNCPGSNSTDDGYKEKYFELLEKDHKRMEEMLNLKQQIKTLKSK